MCNGDDGSAGGDADGADDGMMIMIHDCGDGGGSGGEDGLVVIIVVSVMVGDGVVV